jgi:hypothetical protein
MSHKEGVKILKLVLETVVVVDYISAGEPLSHWDSKFIFAMASACRETLETYKRELVPCVLGHAQLRYEKCPFDGYATGMCPDCQRYGTMCSVVNMIMLSTRHQDDAVALRSLARRLWIPELLTELCHMTPVERRVPILRLLFASMIDPSELPDPSDEEEEEEEENETNQQRTLDLLENIVSMHASLHNPLKEMLQQKRASFNEAITVAQDYYDTKRRCEENMALLLRRLALMSGWHVTGRLLDEAPLYDTRLMDDVMRYIHDRFHNEPIDIRLVMRDSRPLFYRDAYEALFAFWDRHERTNSISCTVSLKLYELLGHIAGRVTEFKDVVHWLETRLQHQLHTVTYRAALVRAVLRHLSAFGVAKTYGIYVYPRELLCAVYGLAPEELHRVNYDIDRYLESLANQKLASPGDHDRTRITQLITRQDTTGIPQQTNSTAAYTPAADPCDMTLEQMCDCIDTQLVYARRNQLGLTVAFTKNFAAEMGDDTGTPVHESLCRMGTLMRAYAKINESRPLSALTLDMSMYYNAMLAIFLGDIVLSVPGLQDQCHCCGVTYGRRVEEFDDIGSLVSLSPDNEQLLKQLAMLNRLPLVDRAFGFDMDMEAPQHDYSDYSAEDEEPLGHYDDDSEDMAEEL